MDLVDILVDLARQLGSHPAKVVLFDEGLVGAKIDGHLVVSRPGARLGSLDRGDFIHFDGRPLIELLKTDQIRKQTEEETLLASRLGDDLQVPGPEAYFVADLLQRSENRLLAHVQPVTVNQILASPRARQFADRRITLNEIFNCGLATALVPYADPGTALAKEVRTKVNLWRDRARTDPKVILLQNNGMVVMGNAPEEIMENIEKMLRAAEVFVGASLLGGPQFLTVANIGRATEYRRTADLVGTHAENETQAASSELANS
ncbi:MAG: class II aldolase/adducin family protein [Verrucomicrobia bacterium]|nr:class II aldolase/adducin family protein [Verrucomicrobiota bacterium]